MVYVAKDGTVCENPPWNLDRLYGIFFGAVSFVTLFFKSLVGWDNSSKEYHSPSSGRSSLFRGFGGGGGSGGSGGGRPGGGGGGSGGPSRRIMTMRDINPPTANFGGCAGGSCGR